MPSRASGAACASSAPAGAMFSSSARTPSRAATASSPAHPEARPPHSRLRACAWRDLQPVPGRAV